MGSHRSGPRSPFSKRFYTTAAVLLVILAAGVSARFPDAPAADPGVIFESNWGTATGNSSNAITDGGRFFYVTDEDEGVHLRLTRLLAD